MRVLFASLVGAVWTLAFLDGVVTGNFTPLGIVTPVMLIITGFMFVRTSNGNGAR